MMDREIMMVLHCCRQTHSSLHAKQGKDRSRQNKSDRQLEYKVKLRGLRIDNQGKAQKEETN